MRVQTLEIRWHDSKPISTCDFQPMLFKKARPTSDKGFTSQTYRLATGGEDNHVRVRSFAILTTILPGAEGRCSFSLMSVVDDTPKYHARISIGRERGGWGCRRGRSSQAAKSRVSRYPKPAFSCRQCRTVQSKW